jgi:hypothetical protein
MPKSSVFHERARFAALTRSRQPDDPEYLAAKRNLAFAKTEAFIKEVVARAPDFTPEQIDQLRVLLELARRDLADICPKSGGGIADAGARGGGNHAAREVSAPRAAESSWSPHHTDARAARSG